MTTNKQFGRHYPAEPSRFRPVLLEGVESKKHGAGLTRPDLFIILGIPLILGSISAVFARWIYLTSPCVLAQNIREQGENFVYLTNLAKSFPVLCLIPITAIMAWLHWRNLPALRAIVRYEVHLIKLWGIGCVFVRPSREEEKFWNEIERRKQKESA